MQCIYGSYQDCISSIAGCAGYNYTMHFVKKHLHIIDYHSADGAIVSVTP